MLTFVALVACPSPEPIAVAIDGPAEVRVESLGPVDLPRATVQRGAEPIDGAEVTWSAAPESVATVANGHVDVLAAGTATVTASYGAAHASYTLTVAPHVTLQFVDPPATLAVGQTTQLVTTARLGDKPAVVESTPTFTSSNDAFATVSSTGTVTGVGPGVVYVTGHLGSSEAMVEIEVR